MEQQGNKNNYRFVIAAVLSVAVLLGWTYFFAPTKPASNTNTAANTNTAVEQPAPQQTPVQQASAPVPTPESAAAVTPDTTPNRKITIKSPLYEATLDTKGAVATSWILLRNVSPMGDVPIFASGSTDTNKIPLQLISEKALEQNPRDVPFRVVTADANLNNVANEKNYQTTAEEVITLAPGEERRIEFSLVGENGVEIKKSFVFRGDSYIADLAIDLKQNGQPVPNARLAVGASIGDHAINHHNFYQIESEAVAAINGDIKRHQGNHSFTFGADNTATLADSGTVDWAGVGDAYFAMTAIPANQVQGVEYHAYKYDVQTQPFYDGILGWITRSPKTSETRHLVTVFLPVATDGSVTKIFTGAKDYFLLNPLSDSLSTDVGRSIVLTDIINFSNYWWLRWLTKPLSIPILYALHYINRVTLNYGLAIIIFTILFYSLLFPLRWSQSRSFKKASANAPKMKELQDKIKALQKKGVATDDPRMRELQMQQIKMTKDALPLGGCLPMVLQFPLLIAFYTAITIALEARQASFMWLPDLSTADPYHILEFVFAGSMVLAMKFTPTTAAVTPEQQMQQKMMTYVMPLMMLWMMWTAPAGLLLYWLCGNIVSFGQQMMINRMNKSSAPPAVEVVNEVPKGAKKVKPKLSTS